MLSRRLAAPLCLLLLALAVPAQATAVRARKPAPAQTADTRSQGENAMEAWCNAIGRRLRSVPAATCRQLGLQASDMTSVRGRPLMVRDYAPPTRQVAQNGAAARIPRVLLIGCIHGDELTAASIVFRWMQWIDEPEARQYHWRVVPVANPDGLLANPPQRVNARGVDLNRNFPTPDWDADAQSYWSARTRSDPRRFPGKSAMSEPETHWLHDQIEAFQPDLIISVHAPFGILDYDGPAHQPRRFGHLDLNRLGVYPGSLGNYGGVHKNMPVITIELPNANAMPSAKEQREIWQDMLTWMRRNIVGRTPT